MEALFLKILNMSITATWVFAYVLLLRLMLKRAPKWISYALWSVVLFRLVSPVSFPAVFSLVGRAGRMGAPAVSGGGIEYIPKDIGLAMTPRVNVGLSSVSEAINGALPSATAAASVNPMQIWIFIGAWVWILGMAVMVAHSAVSSVRLMRRLSGATRISGNSYETDAIDRPFVWGFVKPKIYLPVGLSSPEREHVLRHERAHIARRDHLVKPLAYFALVIHWFNPFMWQAFALMSGDMEMSCDERVVKGLNGEEKAGYSEVLLHMATSRPSFAGSPLAFGESGSKGRIRNVLKYKKPAFWVVVVAVVAAAAVGICLIANPRQSIQIPSADIVGHMQIEQINEGESLGLVRTENAEEISAVLAAFSGAEKTFRQYVNEGPNTVNYFTVKLAMPGEVKTMHLYSEGQRYYIEEPYVGVFKSDRKASVTLAKVYTAHEPVRDIRVEYEIVKVGAGGKALASISPLDGGAHGIAEKLIFDSLIKSTIWPGVDIETLDECWLIRRSMTEFDETSDYYAFLLDGKAVMQHGLDGFYSRINDGLYAEFVEMAEAKIGDAGGAALNEPPSFGELSGLDSAISKAVIFANRDGYRGDFRTEAHTVLGIRESGDLDQAGASVTAYVMALTLEFGYADGGFAETGGSHMPAAITFQKNDAGVYAMTEYWMPMDGSGYGPSIKGKFPEDLYDDAIDTQKYIEAHMQACYEQAIAYGGIDTDARIGSLIETIASSPLEASGPQAYIDAHAIEFRELVYYGKHTLRYCYARFEKGGETGLEGHIMAAACRRILGDSEEGDIIGGTGQGWYEEFKSRARKLRAENGDEYMETHLPGVSLLLEMLEE